MKSTKNEPSLPGQSTVSEDEPVSDEEEYDEDRLPVAKVDTPGKVTEEQDIVRYCRRLRIHRQRVETTKSDRFSQKSVRCFRDDSSLAPCS